MTYQVRRLDPRQGHGPLTVYRAISPHPQSLLQQPMGWVRAQPAFRGLAVSQTAAAAATLAAAGVPEVPKIWTELAYESVRLKAGPDIPSRLDALYAFADPLEALSFTEVTGNAQQVCEGAVTAGVPWVLVDMADFEVVEPLSPDEAGFRTAWDAACERASRYWTPGSDVRLGEILVAGTITLNRRLELLPLLRSLGLVEP